MSIVGFNWKQIVVIVALILVVGIFVAPRVENALNKTTTATTP
jgi:hypothetical protein